MIRFISLHQWYASAMAANLKKNETRSFHIKYRGWLGIHASAKLPRYAMEVYDDSPLVQEALRTVGIQKAKDLGALPLGAVLCVVNLTRCVPTNKMLQHVQPTLTIYADRSLPEPGSMEHEAGNYSPNRYVWVTEDLRSFDPIPCKGRQGLWTAPPEIERRVLDVAGLDL